MSLNRSSAKPSGVAVPGSWEGSYRRTRACAELQSCWLVEVFLERHAIVGKSPVHENHAASVLSLPSSAGSGKAGVNLRGPPRKAKYTQATDSELVP